MGEQRYPRQHAPGDDEIAAADFVGEGGGDDRNRQREHHEAGDDGEPRHRLAQRRDRNHVAIADGAQRHDRPPHRLRNGAELVGLNVVLDGIEQRGEQQHRAGQDHEAAEQRSPLGMKRRQQRAHRRRITHQLEKRQHAEQHQRRPAAGDQRHRGRQECQEVDDAEAAEDIFEPVPRRRQFPRRVAGHAPQPGGVFQRKHRHRANLDDGKQPAETRVEFRHRRQDHRQHVDDDDGNDQPHEARADRIRQVIVFEQFVEPVPQIRVVQPGPARKDLHSQPLPIAFSIAASAALALAPSGPPACAMSGRPPPPLPPSASDATRTRSTALKRKVRSLVTPTTTPALPSSVTATIATTPEPICFLPSSTRLLRSFISMPWTERAISLTLPTSRTPPAPAADPLVVAPPPIASLLRASDRSRSSFLRSSISEAMRAGMSSSVVRNSTAAVLASAMASLTCFRAWLPVSASMRRTPEATALSPVIEIRPISPVRRTWVPPHNSTDQPSALLPCSRSVLPIDTTRTSSPYFSPNSARAPASRASSTAISRVVTSSFSSTTSLAISSMRLNSSGVIGFGCTKSKRNRSGATSEPRCAIWSPSTCRSASCRRCVAE